MDRAELIDTLRDRYLAGEDLTPVTDHLLATGEEIHDPEWRACASCGHDFDVDRKRPDAARTRCVPCDPHRAHGW